MIKHKNGIRFFSRILRIQEIMANVFKILRKLQLNVLEFCSQPNQEAQVPNGHCVCLSPGGNFVLPSNNMYGSYSRCWLANIQTHPERGLWECLWWIILTRLIKVGRSSHCGWPHSLGCQKHGANELNPNIQLPLLLAYGCMQPAIPDFLTMIDCTPRLGANINFFFLKLCLLEYFYHRDFLSPTEHALFTFHCSKPPTYSL